MKRSLVILDDFHPDPLAVRHKALVSDFQTVRFGGTDFHGVAAAAGAVDHALIEQAVGFPAKVNLEFFRIGLSGAPMTSYIHCDQNCGEFATVLYLNLPDQFHGGTSFWRHLRTGCEALPANANDEERRIFAADGLQEAAWKLELFVPMHWNRLLVYPTRVFHSRYPNNVLADDKQEARLVHVSFFDRKESET